jgi:hypothetical protein
MINVRVEVRQEDINSLGKELKKIGKIVTSSNLQLYRANRYRRYTVEMLEQRGLDLKPISEATKIIDGGDHNPEYKSGSLARRMGVRPIKGNAAEAGYFENSPKIPNKEITYTQAAILQHTGFRIPLHGDKGARVRAWLAWKGVFENKSPGKNADPDPTWETTSEHWIHVPARPFMLISYLQYMMTGEDAKAVDEYLQKMMESPMEDPTKIDPLKTAGGMDGI